MFFLKNPSANLCNRLYTVYFKQTVLQLKKVFIGMDALKVYFAGDLFDAKDLGGNLMLASAIERISGNRYKIMLPQNGECEVFERTSQSIRDADFELLYACDCIVANFDGCDLDSGTVVEFCFAKMADMPAVLLRTDFRDGGDHTLPDGKPWNLMCSHYPRTEVLHINAMQRYHQCLKKVTSGVEMLNLFYESIAQEVVAALDSAAAGKSWLKVDELAGQYEKIFNSIGGSVAQKFDQKRLQALFEHKKNCGLYEK